LTPKPDARITKASLTSSRLNLNAANNGFRVLSVTRKTPITNQKSGELTSTKQLQFYAARAVVNCRSPTILNAIRLARIVAVHLIPIAPAIMIFTLKFRDNGIGLDALALDSFSRN
jgi:hypothetical protein